MLVNRIMRAAAALGIRQPKNFSQRFAVLTATIIALSTIGFSGVVDAATLNTASLALTNPQPSVASVNYNFTASGYTSGTTIKCIQEAFSVNADGTGGVPTGMSTLGTTLDSSTNVVTQSNWS